MATTDHTRELCTRLEEQLGRFGMAGKVEIEKTTVRLTGSGRVVEMVCPDIEALASSSLEARTKVIERVARELVQLRRADVAARRATSWSEWIRPLIGLSVIVVGVGAAWRWLGAPARSALADADRASAQGPLGEPSKKAAPAGNDSRPDPETSCQRVSARITTGGSVTVMDRDGWVVELMLLSPDPEFGPDSPKLAPFFAKKGAEGGLRRMVWSEDPELTALDSNDSFVVVTKEPMGDIIAGARAGIRVTWSGQYVAKYFDESSRMRLQRLGAAVYEATGASLGALFARCALGTQHQIGSWFRGKDLGYSVLAVLASMGIHAEVAHVDGADPRTNSPIEQRRVWDTLRQRTSKLDKAMLTLELADDGGMIAQKPGNWATITFPFQDANRATRASLRLARVFGVAPRR